MNSHSLTDVEDFSSLTEPPSPKSSHARITIRITDEEQKTLPEEKVALASPAATSNQLMASDVNNLLSQLKEKNHNAVITEGTLDLTFADSLGYASSMRYTIYDPTKLAKKIAYHANAVHPKAQPIIIFNMSKDARTVENHPELFHIGDLLEAFFKEMVFKKYHENALLMLPVVLCRGYGYLRAKQARKEHAILVSIRLPEKEFVVYDSQTGRGDILYPYCMNLLAQKYQLSYQHHYYGTQKDNHLCGSFVFLSILTYLKTFDFSQLACLNLTLESFKNKENFSKKWNTIHNAMLTDVDWEKISEEKESNIINATVDYDSVRLLMS